MRCFTKKTDTKFARTSIPTTKTMRACCSDAGDFQRPSREISLGIDHILLIADTTKPVSNHKKKDTPTGVFLFGAALLLRKSGRLRAGDLTCKGNPTKVSLAYIPFLAIYRSAHGQQNLWAITKKDFKRNLEVLFLLPVNRCATRLCGICDVGIAATFS